MALCKWKKMCFQAIENVILSVLIKLNVNWKTFNAMEKLQCASLGKW